MTGDWRTAEQAFEHEVLGESTLPELFEDTAARHTDRPAQGYKGGIYDRSLVENEVVPAAPNGDYAHLSYGEIAHQNEVEFSRYNFELADTDLLFHQFTAHEAESKRLVEAGAPLPAYDQCLKCSHVFNMLDARHAISVTERARYIGRVRDLAKACAEGYLNRREELGYPLLKEARA